MESIKYLGVIPARGGSKGIPRKNIRILAGKPLIAWTIDAAKKSLLLDDFIVSTEDEEIIKISQDYGAKVLIRPKELATDEASTLSVLQHILSQINTQNIVLLQPTSPIRNPGLIDECIKRFEEVKPDSLATGFICKFTEYGTCTKRRQDIPGFFYDDGNIYIIKSDIINKGDRFGQKIERVILDREQNVEIDDNFDFWLAEQILIKRKKEGLL